MRPPPADAAAPAVWPAGGAAAPRSRGRVPTGEILGSRSGITALAATVLVVSLAIAAYALEPRVTTPTASAGAFHGTALLGTATCASWQAADATRRLTIIGALAAAATQPDPENPGATLSPGAAYGLFERVCATRSSRTLLLYEAYNRAASMSVAGAVTPRL
jgi:hypothetical protein